MSCLETDDCQHHLNIGRNQICALNHCYLGEKKTNIHVGLVAIHSGISINTRFQKTSGDGESGFIAQYQNSDT